MDINQYLYNISEDDSCFAEFIEGLRNTEGYSANDINIAFDGSDIDRDIFIDNFGYQFKDNEAACISYSDYVPIRAVMDKFEKECPLTFEAKLALYETFGGNGFDLSRIKLEIEE